MTVGTMRNTQRLLEMAEMDKLFEILEAVYKTPSCMLDNEDKLEALNKIMVAYRDHAREKILSGKWKE